MLRCNVYNAREKCNKMFNMCSHAPESYCIIDSNNINKTIIFTGDRRRSILKDFALVCVRTENGTITQMNVDQSSVLHYYT